jgi:NhaP-type Na+/H+ or K+/H+ antiporter
LSTGFPERALIVSTTFCVTPGTLVLQGATLRPLLSIVMLAADRSVEDEVASARREPARQLMQEEYRARLLQSPASVREHGSATGLLEYQQHSMAAERIGLASLRREERIRDAAFQVLEEELDWAETKAGALTAARRSGPG